MPDEQEIAETEIRDALNEALNAIEGVGARATAQIIDEYALRFARLARMDPADAALEYDDLMVNLTADQLVNSTDAQAASIGGVMAVLRVVARLAKSMIFPALPPA